MNYRLAWMLGGIGACIPILLGSFCLYKASLYDWDFDENSMYNIWMNRGMISTLPAGAIPEIPYAFAFSPWDPYEAGDLIFAMFLATVFNFAAGYFIGIAISDKSKYRRIDYQVMAEKYCPPESRDPLI